MKPGAIHRILASWWLTIGLLLSLAAAYLLFTLTEEAYSRWVGFLFHKPIGLFLYCGLVLNLVMASIRVVLNGISVRAAATDAIKHMDVSAELPWSGNRDMQKIAAWMRGKGFRVATHDGMVQGVRGTYSFLPGTVVRAGFVILLVSLLISVQTRETRFQPAHKGETLSFFGSTVTISSIEAGLPQDFLQVGDDSSFLVEKAVLEMSSSGRTYRITPGLPTRINGNYFRLIHLGYAQSFAVHENGKESEKTVDLDILPPGKADIVSVPGSNRFLTVSLEPDRTISKGLLKGKQFNLADPCYRIVVQNGREKQKTEAFTIRPGEWHRGRNLDLSLGKNDLYARVQITRDPALGAVYFGALVFLAGLVLMTSRFFWFRKEITAVMSDSLISIGYREEFFKKWGVRNFYVWKEELQ